MGIGDDRRDQTRYPERCAYQVTGHKSTLARGLFPSTDPSIWVTLSSIKPSYELSIAIAAMENGPVTGDTIFK
jgi:hypothetical protein